jgi:hypothetical protein
MTALASAASIEPRAPRRAIVEHLISALREVIDRYQAMADINQADLHAERVTAEVAHHLAVARAALRRHRPVLDYPTPLGPGL